jgi:hypothetical protein
MAMLVVVGLGPAGHGLAVQDWRVQAWFGSVGRGSAAKAWKVDAGHAIASQGVEGPSGLGPSRSGVATSWYGRPGWACPGMVRLRLAVQDGRVQAG